MNCTLAGSGFLTDGEGRLGLLAEVQLYPLHISHIRRAVSQNGLYHDLRLHVVFFSGSPWLGNVSLAYERRKNKLTYQNPLRVQLTWKTSISC